MKKAVLFCSFIVISVIFVSIYYAPLFHTPTLERKSISTKPLKHPSQVIRIGNNYIAGELFSNDLILSKDLEFKSSNRLVLKENGEITNLASPHFFFALNDNTVLVSEGWGSSVTSVNLKNGTVNRFRNKDGIQLKGPHGLCIDNEGWIYIADSMNSRLVRYKLDKPGPAEIFSDIFERIAYGRQLVCDSDGLWLSNSYERINGLNQGKGSNILHIKNFQSGIADIVASFPETNMTGLSVINKRWIIAGLWGQKNQLVLVDKYKFSDPVFIDQIINLPGPPYGIFYDKSQLEIIVSYPGDIHSRSHKGAITSYRVSY